MEDQKTYHSRTILKAGSIVAAALFVVVAVLVKTGQIQQLDTALLVTSHTYHTVWLDMVVPIVTYLGEPAIVVSVSIVIALILLYKKHWRAATILATGVTGSVALSYLIKSIVERARPELWDRLVHETGFSFPSGHAAASMALALSVVAIVWNTRWRFASCVATGMYVVTIGFTRLYLGVHYPSDVLAGWLVAGVWVAVVVLLSAHAAHRTKSIT